MQNPGRFRQRYTDERPGNGATRSASNRNKSVRGPQPGCVRRSSTILASNSGGI
jgi:hypothetical protein